MFCFFHDAKLCWIFLTIHKYAICYKDKWSTSHVILFFFTFMKSFWMIFFPQKNDVMSQIHKPPAKSLNYFSYSLSKNLMKSKYDDILMLFTWTITSPPCLLTSTGSNSSSATFLVSADCNFGNQSDTLFFISSFASWKIKFHTTNTARTCNTWHHYLQNILAAVHHVKKTYNKYMCQNMYNTQKSYLTEAYKKKLTLCVTKSWSDIWNYLKLKNCTITEVTKATKQIIQLKMLGFLIQNNKKQHTE